MSALRNRIGSGMGGILFLFLFLLQLAGEFWLLLFAWSLIGFVVWRSVS